MITYAQANTIVALASSMAGAHLGACVTRPDRCTSMVTTESSRRNLVAERELIEYLDELIDPDNDEAKQLEWREILAAVGLLKGTV